MREAEYEGLSADPALKEFLSWDYLRHNQRRLEHLATLGLDLNGATVLETGAGIGDHTHFFLDRGCTVTSTEGRPENLKILAARYPHIQTRLLDMEKPDVSFPPPFDIVYCYGLLYHLRNPSGAIEYMAHWCGRLLLLETCVSFGEDAVLNPTAEWAGCRSQALSGMGCRPTRPWIYSELKRHLPHVYLPVTQPNHEEFPLDWTGPAPEKALTRAVFVAARQPVNNALLREEIPSRQRRH